MSGLENRNTYRYFSVGELFGPFPCEKEDCNNTIAWTIKLTKEENSKLPESNGDIAIRYIFRNRLGTALCDNCLKKEKVPNNILGRLMNEC